ncbi:MAG: hypothetical protein ACRD8W_16560 [Nitrososphaeraceae archaeon]
MNKFVGNRTVITGFIPLTNLLAFIYLSIFFETELYVQEQSNISIVRATALSLVNTEGNQVIA